MSAEATTSAILRAKEDANRYQWLSAGESYHEAFSHVRADSSEKSEICERMGHALYRAAFQSGDSNEFKKVIIQAIDVYQEASQSFERLSDTKSKASALRCRAMAIYLQYWLATTAAERKQLLEESWKTIRDALKTYDSGEEGYEYAKTSNQFVNCVLLLHGLEWNFPSAQEILRNAVKQAEKAIEFLSDTQDPRELARALVALASYEYRLSLDLTGPDDQDQLKRKAYDNWIRATKLSEESAHLQLVSNPWGGFVLRWGSDEAIDTLTKALEYAKKTRDELSVGIAFDHLAYHAIWRYFGVEERKEKIRLLEEALNDALQANLCYSKTQYVSARPGAYWIGAPRAFYYFQLFKLEADEGRRRELLDKSLEAARENVSLAKDSGYPLALVEAHHELSQILLSLSQIHHELGEKKRFLAEALEHRRETIRIGKEVQPFFHWNRGIMQNYLSDILSEMAILTTGTERTQLLQKALETKQVSINLCNKWLSLFERTGGAVGNIATIGRAQSEYGDMLKELFKDKGELAHLQKAAETFRNAAETFSKIDHHSRMAECYWKAGITFDSLSQHPGAAENFSDASKSYRSAAEKFPELNEFYCDYSSYMDAWAIIENARFHHAEEQYSIAAEDYTKTSRILQGTKAWNHLSKHYTACSLLEECEALSRRERLEESVRSMNRAGEEFEEAKVKLEMKSQATKDPIERKELSDWIKITETRARYCLARARLESAKLLDKKGDDDASLIEYGEASRAFRRLLEEAETPQPGGELETMTLFCEAGAKMKEAEVRASPQLYNDAANLFAKARKTTANERVQPLAQANSSICKALATGLRFRQTRNPRFYSKIKNQLGMAGDCYEESGLEKAAGWARATQRFFDALVYFTDAEAERDTKKKAELYHLAEKQLDMASRLYAKAGFRGKEIEARRLLRRAREEKELLAPVEALKDSPIVFQKPMPVSLLKDKPHGLERFESASIVGKMNVAEKVMSIGSDAIIELEMTNVGKTPATLIRLEGIAPEGFEIEKEKLLYPIHGNSLDMNGKRLECLKKDSLKIVLKSARKGIFELRPKIVISDDKGNQGSFEFEPIALIVQERGLPENFRSRILELDSRAPLAPDSWFETQKGRDVFQHLVKVFLRDYMSKGLYLERAGWRSLMDVVRELKMPKYGFYGREGREGPVLAELERRGLIERRIFPEERGRGGAVTRVRLAYDNPAVRQFVRQAVFENF